MGPSAKEDKLSLGSANGLPRAQGQSHTFFNPAAPDQQFPMCVAANAAT